MQEQSQESSFRNKGVMVSDGLQPSCSFRFYGGSSAYGGPVFCASSNQALTSSNGDMYGGEEAGGSASEVIYKPPNSQPNSDPSLTMNSSGELGARPSGKTVAFSAAQLQLLEKQTMIYKYMMASSPVPSELLIHMSKHPSDINPNAMRGGSSKSEVSSNRNNSSDSEPWRCRRTDGKKWRCSRDVVPEQKYCERHSHKSRPRSRKPVELPPSHSTNSNTTVDPFVSHMTRHYHQVSRFDGPNETPFPICSTFAAASSSYDQPRGLRWFTKEDATAVPNVSINQDLHQMVLPEMGSNKDTGGFGAIVGFDYDQHYGRHDQTVSPSLGGTFEGLFNPNQEEAPETRHFLDAWSKAEQENCSLTLSMSGGGDCYGNCEIEENQMGERHHHPWMSQEAHWMDSPPGGPLAEALCLGVPNGAKGDQSGCNIIGSTAESSCSRSTG